MVKQKFRNQAAVPQEYPGEQFSKCFFLLFIFLK